MYLLYIFIDRMRSRIPQVLLRRIMLLSVMLLTHAQADVFEKLLMPGDVIQGHAKYEQECSKCHEKLSKKSQNHLCRDCHEDVDKDITKKKGFHGKHKAAANNACKTCHIEHVGRQADIVKLDANVFPHKFTDFPLKGAHKILQCKQCHEPDKKHREAPGQCYQCHKDNPHKGRLGKKCTQCHSQESWQDLSFDHDKTKFKLRHKHKKLACNSCHINNKYKDTPKSCYSCHSVDDVHKGKNGKSCQKCHSERTWETVRFDHNKETKFKLFGRHAKLECQACHPKNPYKVKIKKQCYACHKKDDAHKGQFGVKCQTCHGVKQWNKTRFNHNKQTDFKLRGAHKTARCVSCHKKNVYKENLSAKCISCHKLDDVHKGQTGKNCKECHNETSWSSKLTFEHDMSGFPLTGLHAVVACDECHLSKAFKKVEKQCHRCHADDDVHKARLGPKCEQCHNTNGWDLWRFDHNKDTSFKLDGAHEKLHCYHCHSYPAYYGIDIAQTCGACHAGDDPHGNQFGSACEQCHDTESFLNINMMR